MSNIKIGVFVAQNNGAWIDHNWFVRVIWREKVRDQPSRLNDLRNAHTAHTSVHKRDKHG